VKELYSVGARWTEAPIPASQDSAVIGFSTDADGVEELKSRGVGIIKDEPAPFFASMAAGLAKEHGMRGYKTSVNHGEPGPHVRSVARILEVLSRMIGFEIDMMGLQPSKEVARSPQPTGTDIYH